MTQTVYGIALDKLGHARSQVLEQGPRRPELRTKHWATPSGHVCTVQNEAIPVDYDHDHDPLGQVVYLERRHGALHVVAHIHDDFQPYVNVKVGDRVVQSPTDLFWSVRRRGGEEYGFLFDSIALTQTPARICAKPVTFLPGALDYRQVARERWGLGDTTDGELLTRAAVSHLDRRKAGGPLVVQDIGGHPRTQLLEHRSVGHIETRSASTLDVNTNRREVDLLIVPAESPARIHERGRDYVETFSHGAFAGCETDPGKIRLNRDHQIPRAIGVAVDLDPWSQLGLVGTFKVSKVADGDEALELLRDGVAAASAGFRVADGGDRWTGNNRRVRRAVLHHVAVTADPAHDTAVLAVRDRDALLA